MRRLLLLIVLAGCSRTGEAGSFRLRIAAAGELAPLSPAPMGSYSTLAQDWVFEGLLRLEADGTVKPALASRWDRLDGKSVRAWIRPDARFSDGSPVGMGDIIASLTSSGLKAHVQEGAIVIESESVLPETILSRTLISKTVQGSAIGTGPFAVVEQDPSHMLLRRNHKLADHIGEVLLQAFKGPREAFLATLAGDEDSYPLIDPKQVEFFQGVPRFRLLEAPSVNAIAVSLNTKRLDRPTRLALVAALRQPDLVRLAYPAGCAPMGAPTDSFRPLPPGRRLNISGVFKVGSSMERMALAVQRALGPRAGEIEDLSLADYRHRVATGEFDLAIELPVAWPPSEMALLWRTNSPLVARNFSNPRVDAAIDAGDWARAMTELADDPPVAFICLPARLAIIDARFKNARIGPYGFFETLPDWEVDR